LRAHTLPSIGSKRKAEHVPYIDVFEINTYYEVRGNGDPVVLLHGALAGADSWSLQQPALEAAGFQIWAPERRGHRHTADTLDPFTYADMTRQTIAFLDSAIGRPAHIIGWSDGAVIAARIAIADRTW
jgi:pimeloyl-ACP methyl ester carboxylesterase